MDPADVTPGHGSAGRTGAAFPAVVTLDGGGRVVSWSPSARRLLGHRSEDVAGRPFADLFADDDSEARRLLRGTATGEAYAGLRHEDGGRVDAMLVVQAVPDVSAGIRVLLIAAAPPEGSRDKQLLEWAFDAMPFSGGIRDLDLRVVRANREAIRTWGFNSEQLIGRRPTDLLPSPDGEEIERSMARAVETGEPTYFESSVRLPGEPHKHAWAVHSSPLKDERGQVRGLYTLGIDITKQRSAQERLALLNDTSTRVGSTLDVRETAEELARVLVPDMADFVTVDLLESVLGDEEPGTEVAPGPVVLRRNAQRSVLEGCPESVLRPGDSDTFPADSPHVYCLVTGQPQIISATGSRWFAFSDDRASRVRDFGMHSALVVPLRARGAMLGVAIFTRHRHPEPFSEDDLLLAEEITARAAVSIDNALRYTRQRRTALMLQHSLLPHELPRLSALSVAGRYLPSDASAGVGGDWFDVIPLSGARVALVVGDVVGHGIQASASMGRLRTAVRTLADLDLPPDELLAHLDDVIGTPATVDSEGDAIETLATCLYAVYDPISRHCSLARAGHPPPALVLPDGTVGQIDVPAGPPLGLGGFPFEPFDLELPEGSMLALYTDGLVESRERDIDEGQASLRDVLAVSAGKVFAGDPAAVDLEETCDMVLGALLPDRPGDDVALLLARTRAFSSGHVAAWELPVDPAIVAEARERVARQLAIWGLEDMAFTTEVIVSELVTNAIRHGSGPIRLRLIWEDALICEVSDSSDTFPRPRRAHAFDEDGRGLMLVAQLSRRWGTRPGDTGKVIWADQALPRRAAF